MKHKDIVKLLVALVALSSILLFVALVDAQDDDVQFGLVVINGSEVTTVFSLYWQDHPYKHINPGPIIAASGELRSGSVWKSVYLKEGKKYVVAFSVLDEVVVVERILPTPSTGTVKVTFDGKNAFVDYIPKETK